MKINNFWTSLKQPYKRLLLICSGILLSLLVVTSILIAIAYFLTPQLTRYHTEVVAHLSELLQHPVSVERLTAKWADLGPVVELENVEIWDISQKTEVMSIEHVEIHIGLWDLFYGLIDNHTLVPKGLIFDKLHAHLRQTVDDKIEVVGFESNATQSELDLFALLEKITAQDTLEINDTTFDLQLLNGDMVLIKNVNATLEHTFNRVQIKVSADLANDTPGGHLNALVKFDPRALKQKQWEGEVDLSITDANLPLWMSFWPSAPALVQSGVGDVKAGAIWEAQANGASQLVHVDTAVEVKKLELHVKSSTANSTPLVIALDDLNVNGVGNRTAQGWSLMGDSDVAPITGGSLTIHGNVQLAPVFAESHVELYVQADDVPIAPTLKAYTSEEFLPTGLDKWLEESIRSGTVQQAHLVMRGILKEFPFADETDKQQGVLELTADIKDVDLYYHPSWQPLTHIDGQIILQGNEFFAIIDKGEIANGQVIDAAVVIPELKREGAVVNVTGKVAGMAQDTVAFLKASPMWTKLQEQLSPLTLEGPVEVDLDLDIYLEKNAVNTGMGSVSFNKGTVKMPSLDLTFTEVIGKVVFDEVGVYADNLSAKFYGEPITAQLATQTSPGLPNFLKVAMQGNMKMADLAQRYPNPLWADWNGRLPFTAEVDWRNAQDKNPSRLQLNSNLQGLTINLPQPFAKTAATQQPFTFISEFGNGKQRTQIKYGKLADADLYFTKQNNKTALTRGLVRISPTNNSPTTVPANSLQIVGYMPVVDIDAWVPIAQNYLKDTSTATTLPAVNAQLTLDQLTIASKNLAIKTINVQRNDTSPWKVNLSGKDAQGQVLIPAQLKQKPIDVSLAYLNWTSDETIKSKNDVPPPDNFPNFNVNIKQISLNGVNRGSLKLATQMGNKVMYINSLRLDHPDYTLTATGRWSWPKLPSTTSLKGKVTTKNLGGMLKTWGISSGMQGGKGVTTFDLYWQGGPGAWDIDDLQGEVIVDWTNGRLVDVKPGLGRIISLFNVNMQSLSRRLRLDFSDLFKEGFTFDKVTANLAFNNGVINTKNGEVTSSAGKIVFSGNAYTVSKTLDLNLTVTPALSSTPIAAGLAIANPLVGAAVWAVDKAVAPTISKNLVGKRYHVTGPWAEPVITELKGKQKTTAKK